MKLIGISPYAYCGGDPVSIIDEEGQDLVHIGLNKSSVTFKTDLVDKSFDAGKIGIDWGGELTFEGDELLSAALDIAGVVDPTGVADLANAGLQLQNGEFLGAAISAIGVIPYAGDLAKAAKIGKPIEGKYDLGHKNKKEYRKLKAEAESNGMIQKEFNEWLNDPDLYQIEDSHSNRSHKFEHR